MNDTPLHYLELNEVAQRMRDKVISSVEVTEAIERRIDRLDPEFQCFVHRAQAQAAAGARRADAAFAAGTEPGRLQGVPIAIKDIFWTADMPTAAGMAIHRDYVAPRDATVIRRIKESGGVLLGKLALTEGVYAEYRSGFPRPVNPWDANLWCGASSSGSAVAVASGMCFAALSSETGGSIKLPAAANGVTAIKPTWGRVSRDGVFELAATLDHVGAHARSAADLASVLAVIAGRDALDPSASHLPVEDYLAGLTGNIEGLRIGVDTDWTERDVDAETASALRTAIRTLERLGARIVPVSMPDGEAMMWDWFGACAVQTALAHETTYPLRAGEYGALLSQLIETGRAFGGMDYQRLLTRRDAFRRALDTVFETVDVLALPVLAGTVPTWERIDRMDDALIAELHRFTCPFNMSGHPGVVMPCGIHSSGAPIVFQLVGPYFAEASLLKAGDTFQRETDWHRRHPHLE